MKEKHLVKNPEKELLEEQLKNKYLETKLKKTWDYLLEIGCEIDSPLSMNFNIYNKKADKLIDLLQDIDKYVYIHDDIPLKHKVRIKKIIKGLT